MPFERNTEDLKHLQLSKFQLNVPNRSENESLTISRRCFHEKHLVLRKLNVPTVFTVENRRREICFQRSRSIVWYSHSTLPGVRFSRHQTPKSLIAPILIAVPRSCLQLFHWPTDPENPLSIKKPSSKEQTQRTEGIGPIIFEYSANFATLARYR